MEIHYGFEGLSISNAIVTTGSFDGVHLGHQTILKRLCQKARELDGQSVLISFFPHPRKVLYPDTLGKDLRMINTQEEKIYLLSQMGIDHLIIVDFTLEFSKTSSLQFVRNYLVKHLHMRHVIIGFNHHFGHNREGDLDHLEALGKYFGFSVEEIPEQDIQNESVSSTKIRKALIEGNIQRANAYLDHPYLVSGRIQECTERSECDLMHLEIPDQEKLLPPPGCYAVTALQEPRTKGAVWIDPDSFDRQQLSVFLFDPVIPSDGGSLILSFFKRISPFDSSGRLENQRIKRDLQFVQDLIY